MRICAVALTALALIGPVSPAAAAERDPGPPAPPPVSVNPPAGRPPGPAAGLHQNAQCNPARADAGTSAAGAGDGADRLQLTGLHRIATGRGQLIAMIDTGVHPHPLLGNRLRGGGDYLTGGDGLDDCDGHGTAVAGLLAAGTQPGPDGRGGTPIGIAPGAGLLSIRQSSRLFEVPAPGGGLRPPGDVDTLADAIVLAVRQRAGVINISEAACLTPKDAATDSLLLHAALRYAAEQDVVVVAAAGNIGPGSCEVPESGQVTLPGWYDDEVLTVGAVGPDDAPAPFTFPGSWVDVAAPGMGLRSLAVGGGTTTTGTTGTSFAAPWVAGLAALVRERFPDLSAKQVTNRILATARRPAGGQNKFLGHGVIDPMAALTAVPDVLEPPTIAAAAARSAELPGTKPAPAPAGSTGSPDAVAAGVLLGIVGIAAALLRRRPRRSSRRS